MFLDRSSYTAALPEMESLFAACFGRRLEPGVLAWRYLAEPSGDLLANVEYHHERLIANYSASPVCLISDGQPLRSALSMTTMTHSDFAGQGHFTRLARELYAEMAHRDYQLVWGFPNTNSHRPFIAKLNWRDVYEIPTLELRIQNARLPAIAPVRDDGFALSYAPQIPLAGGIYVRKDPTYLRWRYASHPSHRYHNLVLTVAGTVTSFCLVKPYGDTLDLVDMQAASPEQAEQLLSMALAEAAELGLKRLTTWAPRHHFLHGLYEKIGFSNQAPITYFGLCQLKGRPLSTNFADWYLQMGDSDVY